MKTGFKETNPDLPSKKMKSPWNFDCPPYDERSSNYVNAGWHHGVGKAQPVGRSGNPKAKVTIFPMGDVSTMKVDEVPVRNLSLDIQE